MNPTAADYEAMGDYDAADEIRVERERRASDTHRAFYADRAEERRRILLSRMKTSPATSAAPRARVLTLSVPAEAFRELKASGTCRHVIERAKGKRGAGLAVGVRVNVRMIDDKKARAIAGSIVGRRDESAPDSVPGLGGLRAPVAVFSVLSDAHAEVLRPTGQLFTYFPDYVAPAA